MGCCRSSEYSLSGLLATNSSNFTVLYPDGKPTPLALEYQNWQDEASLDVEWAYSIAPGAKIVIEIMRTQDGDEFEFAIDYADRTSSAKSSPTATAIQKRCLAPLRSRALNKCRRRPRRRHQCQLLERRRWR